MEGYKIIDFIRRHKKLFIISPLLLIITLTVSNYSFISIEVTGSSPGGELTYRLLNQNGQKTTEIKTSSTKIKKIVPKASYEILVTQNEKSSFSVAKTGGFFTNTTVQAKVEQERSRQFIGNNPGTCMYYAGSILYTYGCSDSFSAVAIHVPATTSQPTYITKNTDAINGAVEGIAKTKAGVVALIGASEGSASGAAHTAYLLQDGLKLTSAVALQDLDAHTSYSMKPYKTGFIVYDSSFSKIRYYASVAAKPETITGGSPDDRAMLPFLISTSAGSIITAYSNNTQGETANLDSSNTSKQVKTDIYLYENGKTKKFAFNNSYTVIKLCGNQKLCMLGDKTLSVYSISSERPDFLFSVKNVHTIENFANSLLVVREHEIIQLNVDTQSGFIGYRLGDFQFCGTQDDIDGYLLCLIDNTSKKVALRINGAAVNNDNIDKKVEDLQKLSEVKGVSAYGKYIFISPNLGQVTYNNSLHSFGYDPATKKVINSKIDSEVTKLGVDRAVYKVINTLQ